MIDEKKQIEEMANDIHLVAEAHHFIWCVELAKYLYNKSYRKQSEGEWVANPHISISKRGRTIHYETFKCSVCGKWNGRKKQKYCPNCGAKMKGE